MLNIVSIAEIAIAVVLADIAFAVIRVLWMELSDRDYEEHMKNINEHMDKAFPIGQN